MPQDMDEKFSDGTSNIWKRTAITVCTANPEESFAVYAIVFDDLLLNCSNEIAHRSIVVDIIPVWMINNPAGFDRKLAIRQIV